MGVLSVNGAAALFVFEASTLPEVSYKILFPDTLLVSVSPAPLF